MRVSERTYEAIRAAILEGELSPGVRIHDRRLAEILAVSRTPVRDALHKLECDGLVERRSHIGWMVADFNPEDVREVFELRRVFESLGLKQLAQSWDAASVQELSNAFKDFPDQLPDDLYSEYLERDHAFHRKIVECSQNTRLVYFYRLIENQIDRVRHYLSFRHQGRVETSLTEHRQICSAIASHDLEAATALLLNHLDKVEELMTTVAEQELKQWNTKRGV